MHNTQITPSVLSPVHLLRVCSRPGATKDTKDTLGIHSGLCAAQDPRPAHPSRLAWPLLLPCRSTLVSTAARRCSRPPVACLSAMLPARGESLATGCPGCEQIAASGLSTPCCRWS